MSSRRPPSLAIGVVGVGRMGTMHTRLLAAEVPGARLAAVADTVPALARRVAAQLGVPAVGTTELLTSPRVDAVAICTSTENHVALIDEAAAAGKPVFCEKPISLDLASTDRALAAAAGAGIPLMVGFNRRFDPAHEAVARAVAAGEIGLPELVRISSRDPAPPTPDYVRQSGGIFLDMTVHDFDMARYLTGSDIVEVWAEGAVRVEQWIGDLGDVDTAVVTLRHANGCLTAIDNSRRAAYGYDQRVEVFGSSGLAAAGNPLASPSMVCTAEGARLPALPHFFTDRYAVSYQRQWQAFVGAVTEGRRCPVSGVDGRAALVAGLAAGRALAEHRPVRTCEVSAIEEERAG